MFKESDFPVKKYHHIYKLEDGIIVDYTTKEYSPGSEVCEPYRYWAELKLKEGDYIIHRK